MISGALESVAVTGAAGFLGQHLVSELRARSVRVVPIVRDIDARSPVGSRAVATVLEQPSLLDGVDAIVHAAAIRPRAGIEARMYVASNVELVRALLQAARSRVRRFVLVSSADVYGFPPNLPITEEFPFAPANFYAETKVQAERLLRDLAPRLKIEFAIVRPARIYGPGDHGSIDRLVKQIEKGRYAIVGNGQNSLHHIHLDDVLEGILGATAFSAAAGEDMILAGPETTTLERLSRLVASKLKADVPPFHVPMWLARALASGMDAAVSAAASRDFAFARRDPPINNEKLDALTESIAFDTSKAKRLIGFLPRVTYEEGIERTLEER